MESLGIVMEYHPVTLEDFLKELAERPRTKPPLDPQDLYNICIQVSLTVAVIAVAAVVFVRVVL